MILSCLIFTILLIIYKNDIDKKEGIIKQLKEDLMIAKEHINSLEYHMVDQLNAQKKVFDDLLQSLHKIVREAQEKQRVI